MKRVVDASVATKWYVPEIYEQEVTRLQQSGDKFHAPELILPEFGNIVWKKVLRQEITEKEGQRIVTEFSKTKLIFYPHASIIKSVYTGAAMTNQTVYDWTYLALAVSLGCEFVTADERFYKALEKTGLKKYLLWMGDI
ncbi:MAG: type II toxin-antitoxin system VapC family toxin [Acidobacteria bacterium]|nr:type II toxin-antitoxin system VapC family toxin [Acidobacteriota bacterium]